MYDLNLILSQIYFSSFGDAQQLGALILRCLSNLSIFTGFGWAYSDRIIMMELT